MTQKSNKKYIRVCEPYITKKEIDFVSRAVKEGNISSTAKYVELFEKAFAKKFGIKYAVAVNSGGSALFLALWALGVRGGDEVIVPTFTMVATANAVVQCRAKPVFVDCEENGNIDVKKIEEKITQKTKAIIPVHIYGHPCDMDKIMAIAKKHKLLVVEDAAEAHGALYKNKLAGTFGEAGCFSFYANKVMTTGEGGMIITNNAALYKKLIKLKAYYFHDKRHFWHEQQAWNLRMSALEASLGLAQLERLNELVDLRRKNAKYYTEKLQDLKDFLVFPSEKKGVKSVFWMYGLVLKKGNRDKLMKFLEKNGVETRTYFFPMHWQPIYKEKEAYPVADRLGKNGLYLPSSSQLTKKEKDRVVALVKKFFET